ncbi:peroxide stress protein YaaA [Helicobacter trogontum]|uniref:Peroxide stress protein YaaA n=1 Tax=Helicobacter trogontum TaxID=50960 RepID=A0A4U8SBG6_9HELI|nr:peroxide stress protein YaaA [Helicobacter trogontum]TLD83399.1 peroxide stress protein YaaA [Helicobacter trogontum]
MNFVILFSPSEDKFLNDDDFLRETSIQKTESLFFLESLWQNEVLNHHRIDIITHYYDALSAILEHRDKALLESIYGAKSFNDKNIFDLHAALHSKKLLKAIERYNGVAFQGLSFHTLSQNAKDFILHNVLIFSNLFGVIRASDSIPYYKLKQGTKIKNLTLKDVYAPFILPLEQIMQTKQYVIDLRAGIYTKLFKPTLPHFFFEFQKEGKTISHYAKLYRGNILRLIAQDGHNLMFQECFDYLCSLHDANFRFHSYTQKENCFTLCYEILS